MVTGNMIETKLDKRSLDTQPRPQSPQNKMESLIFITSDLILQLISLATGHSPRVVALQPLTVNLNLKNLVAL